MPVKNGGFTLMEILVAMALSGILMLGALRLLPQLQRQTLQLHSQTRLQDDLQLMLNTLEKAIRRAGYCRGDCEGASLTLRQGCLLTRWDENGNGRWEGPNREESEWYGYRLRDRRLEMLRGAESCEGGGWESLSDPAALTVNALDMTRRGTQVMLTLRGTSVLFPAASVTLRSVVEVWNQR